MKRKVVLMMLSAMMLFFVSCADEPDTVSVEEAMTLIIAGEEVLPEEFKPLNEKAKADIAERFGSSAMKFLSVFEVIDNPMYKYNGYYELEYRISIYGYGYGNLRFAFDTEGEIVKRFELNEEPLRYSDMLTEKKVLRAVEKIAAEVGEPIDSGEYYFFIDNDNYLCLGTEIIVEFEETDAEGNLYHDHKHVFYNERLVIRFHDFFDFIG
jgi:hypothetical protein